MKVKTLLLAALLPVICVAAAGGQDYRTDLLKSAGYGQGKYIFNGAFIGDEPDMNAVREYESRTGTRLDSVLIFHAMKKGFYFPSETCRPLAENRIVPFIKFEPWSWGGPGDESFSLHRINKGEFDEGLKNFAREAAEFGYPFYFSFGHEMNADMNNSWYPWQGYPVQYRKAYRRLHKIFESEGANNAKWVWVINANTAPPELYYPGNSYVDWVAMDGYSADWNGNPSDPRDLFEGQYLMLKNGLPSKPVMIAETGYDLNSGGTWAGKKQFVIKLPMYCAERNMPFFYFDTEKKEGGKIRRWGLDGGLHRLLGDSVKACQAAMPSVPDRRIQPDAKQAAEGKGLPLTAYVSVYGSFNEAVASIMEHKGQSYMDMSFSGADDPGIAVNLRQGISGKLAFESSGSVRGGSRKGRFTVLFIKSLISGDKILREVDISPSAGRISFLTIPPGTDKINFMAVGQNCRGTVRIKNIRVI